MLSEDTLGEPIDQAHRKPGRDPVMLSAPPTGKAHRERPHSRWAFPVGGALSMTCTRRFPFSLVKLHYKASQSVVRTLTDRI